MKRGGWTSGRAVSLQKLVEEPESFAYLTPQDREICACILGPGGLKIPRDAEARLLEGLAAVAPMVTVHSDIAGDESAAETMAAEARPHLHLSPFAAGPSLELRMHPFGDSGPQLLPGQGRATLLTEIEGRAVRCTRDLEGERTAAREVLDACPALRDNASWSWSLDDLETALTTLEQLHALGEAVVLDWPEGKRIGLTPEMQMAQLRVKIEQEGDWLDLQGEIRLDSGRILLMQELLDLAAAAKGRFIPLGERAFLVLSQALRRKLDGLRGLTDNGRFHPLAAPAIAEAIDGMTLDADKAWQSLLDRLAAVEELEPEIPSTLQAELRDYQVEGYRWLTRLAHWGAGACLADDMGLGKTLQALALILSRAPKGPTLVLAPTSVCGNWIDEAGRFAPTLQPRRFGSGDRAAMLDAAGRFDLIICSSGLLGSLETFNRRFAIPIEQNKDAGARQRLRQVLRRACCHPRLALPDSDLSSAKLDAFNEILDELLENRHKALVFSQFVDHLSLIRAHLDARGIRYQYLDGSTPEPQRRAAVAAFQAGEGELFLISLRAGGVGLHLTAADYVIHMDPWWNPAVEDQASDRAHRIGQQRPVTVYRLVAKDTIEERILALHAAKRDLADGLLEGSEGGGRLSYADMLALVRG